ncbi:type IV secretory system conjugative DNA transfer family protein (plasmid) [Agrobacterium tumefaciens]|uniref:type IV secretion system DNA-binding domain-containing protein n=1 Tax=Agrobacterium tumefaciens TaxID=358 RepID=UPI0021D33476|nr:type IV secretion system DNA-binding domain-containing protein [Agrobacterium tumefaciens]UXT53259.1 type IV secretory system conjugative DNA transfer family protein [Agrobacterium tumefaciens]
MMTKIREYVELASKRLVTFTDVVFSRSGDALLRGDLLAYAQQEYPPKRFPTAWVNMPKDIRRSLVWDGRLLNGRNVAELAKSQVTDSTMVDALVRSGLQALKLFVIVSLLVGGVALWGAGGGDFYSTYTEYPSWAADNGAILPVLMWYLLWPLEHGWSLVFSSFALGLPLLLLIPVFWAFAFSVAMNRIWGRVSHPLRAPTRDTKVHWKMNMAIRPEEYEAYCREVANAIIRLRNTPIVAIGQATGLFRSRGVSKAPKKGQLVAFDGESMRQHTLVLGGTGVGKTRLVMRPLFARIMKADWGADHKMGAYVTDGKGTLWRDLLPVVAHRDDVRVVGIGEGEYGINLIAGMTPQEVSNTFEAICGGVTGAGENKIWSAAAGYLLLHAARVARALELDPATVDEWISVRSCRPYSLLGIHLIATEIGVMSEAMDRVLQLAMSTPKASDEKMMILVEGSESVGYLGSTHLPMLQSSSGTASSVIFTINSTIGQLRGHSQIRKFFCSGLARDPNDDRTKDYPLAVDVDHALRGGVILIAVSAAKHGQAGRIITTWLKTRLYMLAARRMDLEPEACKVTSCALFADEFQDLAVVGPEHSDSTAWAVLRESGLFLTAATQNLAALQDLMGPNICKKFLSLMSTKIIMRTDEEETIEFAKKASGKSLVGYEIDEGFYATQDMRERALGTFGSTEFKLGGLDGLMPQYFSAGTGQRKAHDASWLQSFVTTRGGGLGDSTPPKDNDGHYISIATRDEDKNREAMVGNLVRIENADRKELQLGMGYAFCMWQRAGGDKADIIDLNILADAA